ncbi:hypothetical protein ACLI4Z_18245 [Natrialbaceae archaeon A-arb3/5]
MTDATDGCSIDSAVKATDLCTLLSTTRRRAVLRLVADRSPRGIEKEMLATRLAAVTNDKRPASVTDDERQRVRIELTHKVLPVLSDAGVLAMDDGTVTTTDHWLFEDHKNLLADELPDDVDNVFEALGNERRRTLLAVLRSSRKSHSTRAVAQAVAAEELDTSSYDAPDEHVDEVQMSLVHVHLPMLSEAGLIAYDPVDSRSAYEGHPLLRNELEWVLDSDRTHPDAIDGAVPVHS